MKIVSWNCCGKFREKYKFLTDLDADIYVVQECENPEKYKEVFESFNINYIWSGENENKGLGVFIKKNIYFCKNDWKSYCLRNFISLKINGSFDLLCVWACHPYIEEYYIYQCINIDYYSEKMIIIGDFNSNTKWDKKHGNRNHSAVVSQLKEKNIISAYHFMTNEQQGSEIQNTFFQYRHLDKGHHIDYCFLNADYIKDFQILDKKKWISYSDHIPILIEIHDMSTCNLK